MRANNYFILGLIFLVLTVYSVFAGIVTTVNAPLSVAEDVDTIYNFTINNTDSTANFTQINLTLPGSFTFKTDSNITTGAVVSTFVNTSNVLSWSNITHGLVLNLTLKNFLFNASASTPGTFTINITIWNGTGVIYSNVNFTINDTTAPSNVSFTTLTYGEYANISATSIPVNISVTDNGNVNVIRIYLFNSTGFVNNTNSTTNPFFFNFTGLAEGVYYVNATVNDSYNNVNNTGTGTRAITLDTTNPVATFSCDDTSVLAGELISCSCNSTDTRDSNPSESYTSNPSTSNAGTFTTTCTATDNAGNIDSENITYTVSNTGSSSSSSSSSSESYWTNTISYSDEEFSLKKLINKELKIKERIRIKVNDKIHYVGITKLSSTEATVNVSSKSQQATLDVKESAKFDVNENGYYSVLVTLNSINSTTNKANVSITSINERIPGTTSNSTGIINNNNESNSNQTATGKIGSLSGKTWVIVIIVILILVIAGYYLYYKKR